MSRRWRGQGRGYWLVLAMLSTAALAQSELPPLPDLPPIEPLPPVGAEQSASSAAAAAMSAEDSLRDKSVPVTHPEWNAAVQAQKKDLAEIKLPDLPALPDDAPPALHEEVPDYDAVPSPPIPAIPHISPPPAAQEISNSSSSSGGPPALSPPLAIPELPDLPDFTTITEPEGNMAAQNPLQSAVLPPVLGTTEKQPDAPPAEPSEGESESNVPTIADLLKEPPAEENKLAETAENQPQEEADTEDNHHHKAEEVVWPRSFSTQTLPMQIYRKQYSGVNAHLPRAQYYQEMELHMFHAVAGNNLNGIRALMDSGVPINIRSPQGETLLSYATRYRAYSAVRLLLAFGANPNDANPDGSTPLHYATQAAAADVVLALMAAGADPRSPDMNGVSALQVAQMQGNQQMMALLNYSRFSRDMQPAGYTTYMR